MTENVKESGFSTALEVTQGIGLGVTGLAVTAIITEALIFAIVLVPLVVFWPVVIGCGCAAILGLVAFAIAYGMAGKRHIRTFAS
jgi:hypothetical protein